MISYDINKMAYTVIEWQLQHHIICIHNIINWKRKYEKNQSCDLIIKTGMHDTVQIKSNSN